MAESSRDGSGMRRRSSRDGSGMRRVMRHSVPWLLVALLLHWFLPTFVWHVRRTLDPYTFNDDARILVWPFFRDFDARLFPGDLYAAYYLAGLPEGYRGLFHLVGRLGWAVPTSELLQYVSVLSVVALLAITAHRLGGKLAAFVAAVLALGSESFFDRAGGGLPRAFAFPLVCVGLYALVAARPRLLAAMAVAGAAFYPVVAALLGSSLFLFLVLPPRLRRDADEAHEIVTRVGARKALLGRVALLTATLVAIVVLVVPMSLRLRDYGDTIGPSALTSYPEAGLGGRLTRDQHPPFEPFTTVLARHARSALLGTGEPIGGRVAALLRRTDQKANTLLALVVVVAAVGSLYAGRRQSAFLRPWVLLVAAAVGHTLACLVAPRLFLPERYVQYAVPPVTILLVASGIGRIAGSRSRSGGHAAKGAESNRGDHRDEPTPLRILGAALVAAAVLITFGGRGTSWIGVEVHVPREERALYTAIAALPPNVVIAGWPAGPLENIPYLARRRVLTNFQLEMPFHTRFTLKSRERLRALFEAYLAEAPPPIERLCSEFDVTHFLIDSNHYSHGVPDYYEPHRAALARRRASTGALSPLLAQLATRPQSQHFGDHYTLIELAQIPELARACSDRRAP